MILFLASPFQPSLISFGTTVIFYTEKSSLYVTLFYVPAYSHIQ